MRGFAATLAVEVRLFLRDPAAAPVIVLLPLLLLLLNGGADGSDIEALAPALFGFVLASVAVAGLPQGLAEHRERGVFRRLSLTEIRPATVLAVQAVMCLALTLLGAAVLAGVAAAWFDLPAPTAPLNLVVGLVLGGGALFAVGLAIAGAAPSARAATAIAMGTYFPVLFLSGAAYPRERLPELAQDLGALLPLTWAVEAFEAGWGEAVVAWRPAAALAAWAAAAWLVALRAFRWTT